MAAQDRNETDRATEIHMTSSQGSPPKDSMDALVDDRFSIFNSFMNRNVSIKEQCPHSNSYQTYASQLNLATQTNRPSTMLTGSRD